LIVVVRNSMSTLLDLDNRDPAITTNTA